MRGNVWGDFSQCPLSRSTSLALVPASKGGAHAVARPPGHAEGAFGGVLRACTCFRAAWTDAGRQPTVRPPSQGCPLGALCCLPRAGPPRAVFVRTNPRRRRGARLRSPLAQRL